MNGRQRGRRSVVVAVAAFVVASAHVTRSTADTTSTPPAPTFERHAATGQAHTACHFVPLRPRRDESTGEVSGQSGNLKVKALEPVGENDWQDRWPEGLELRIEKHRCKLDVAVGTADADAYYDERTGSLMLVSTVSESEGTEVLFADVNTCRVKGRAETPFEAEKLTEGTWKASTKLTSAALVFQIKWDGERKMRDRTPWVLLFDDDCVGHWKPGARPTKRSE